MRYIKVCWHHDNESEPIVLYSECDEGGWEIRKVEQFRNGRAGYASKSSAFGGSILGLEPIPPLEEIAKQAEFSPREISKEEFDKAWELAQDSTAG